MKSGALEQGVPVSHVSPTPLAEPVRQSLRDRHAAACHRALGDAPEGGRVKKKFVRGSREPCAEQGEKPALRRDRRSVKQKLVVKENRRGRGPRVQIAQHARHCFGVSGEGQGFQPGELVVAVAQAIGR